MDEKTLKRGGGSSSGGGASNAAADAARVVTVSALETLYRELVAAKAAVAAAAAAAGGSSSAAASAGAGSPGGSGSGSGSSRRPDPELAAAIAQVRNIFPDHGEGFLAAALEHYGARCCSVHFSELQIESNGIDRFR